jgi:hypothetical protein
MEHKFELIRGIGRTNEAAKRIISSPDSALKSTWFPRALLIRSWKYINYYPKVGTHAADLFG